MATATDSNQQVPAAKECHSFTLILSGIDDLTSEIENNLFDAGCGDATLGIRAGTAYLDFDREADSLADAVNSAIRDVHNSGLAVEVVQVVLAGEETIAVINTYLKLRREFARTLPKELAYRVDEIMQAVETHDPEVLRNLLASK